MSKEIIKANYDQLAENYSALIDQKPHNAYYDRPNTLSLLPEINGKKVLDAGCGPGRYAEILMERGAEVTGLDFSPEMIRKAEERNKGNGDFYVHDLSKPFTMCKDAEYHIVLSALVLHSLESWDVSVKEFYRVLKPGGLVIVSIEHPFFDYRYYKS